MIVENIDNYDSMSLQERWYVMAMVANLYYNENLTQNQIADRIYTSRSKVSRLLKEARELGIVEIYIRELWERELEIEKRIQEKFGLKAIRVVQLNETERSKGVSRIGEVAAYYLDSIVKQNMIIGISGGNTLYNIIGYLSKKNRKNIPITVVPIMGSFPVKGLGRDTADLTKNLAMAYGGSYQYLYAPLFVSKADIRNSLNEDVHIKEVLNTARNADIVLTSVGSVAERSWSTYLSEDIWNVLERKGVVGYIGGHFFDSEGNEVITSLLDRMIGVDMKDLKACQNLICVAYGEEKARACLGALRAGLVDTLIVDEKCAGKIMEEM